MCLMSNIMHLICQVEYFKLHSFQAEQKKRKRSGAESFVYEILIKKCIFKMTWANGAVTYSVFSEISIHSKNEYQAE